MDIMDSLGVLFVHLVIGGLMGGFIAVYTATKAVYYLVVFPVLAILKSIYQHV